MPETGYFENLGKYNEPEDEELTDDEPSGDELIANIKQSYEYIERKLSASFSATLLDIINTADVHFDSHKKEWTELLVKLTGILEEFTELTDETEIEERESELEEELRELQKSSK